MTAVAHPTRPRLAWRAWVRSLVRPGPERWVHVVALVGWIVLLGHAAWASGAGSAPGSAPLASHQHGGAIGPASAHAHVVVTTGGASTLDALATPVLWLAMLAATMLPLAAPNLRYLGLHSARRRRTLATVEAVTGWLVVWAIVVVALAALSIVGTRAIGGPAATALAFVAAAAWQGTRTKAAATARCHRTFAPPLDATASTACRRFGARLGADCATSCWALMAAMTAGGHDLFVVVPLAWVSWFERRRAHHVPTRRTTVLVIALTGAVALAVAASAT